MAGAITLCPRTSSTTFVGTKVNVSASWLRKLRAKTSLANCTKSMPFADKPLNINSA